MRISDWSSDVCSSDLIENHKKTRPGFFSRLFRTERWKTWLLANTPLVEAEHAAANLPRKCELAISNAQAALASFDARVQNLESSIAAIHQKIDQQIGSESYRERMCMYV